MQTSSLVKLTDVSEMLSVRAMISQRLRDYKTQHPKRLLLHIIFVLRTFSHTCFTVIPKFKVRCTVIDEYNDTCLPCTESHSFHWKCFLSLELIS